MKVNGVKQVQKIAQESYKGRQNRQNTARRTRKRTIKGISKKASFERRATREGNTKSLLKTDRKEVINKEKRTAKDPRKKRR